MLGIILKARFRDDDPLDAQFRAWAAIPDEKSDLLEGAILVAKTEYPRLVAKKIRHEIKLLTTTAALNVAFSEESYDKLGRLNFALFFGSGFVGDTEDYYNPKNSCINQVLVRKKGLPILLSVLYIEIGRRCGLQLYGVGLPGHFLVKYQTDKEEIFIDPFAGGVITDGVKMRAALKAKGITDLKILEPAPHREIIARMIANLLNFYRNTNDPAKVARLSRYHQILAVSV